MRKQCVPGLSSGRGGEGPGNEARVTLVGISKITVQEIVWFTDN